MAQKIIISFFCFFLLSIPDAKAQDVINVRKIRAGVYVSPPFVMRDSTGYYTGMAIDLWELLEDEMNFKTEYIGYPSWSEMLQATIAGDIDVAVSNISVTYDRAERLKFSFPWFDSGLRILVKTQGQGSMWTELKRNGHLQAYMIIVGVIFLLTIILTFVHRKHDPSFPRNWVNGFAESLYRLVLAIKTGVVNNKNYGWLGKILAVTWMISGVGLVAYVTSSITSSMTAVALTHDIHSLSDLPGKRVGVLAGSVAGEYIRNRGISTITYETINEAVEALRVDEIDAVVEDAPELEYWLCNNQNYNMKVVGNVFHPDKYAFAANKRHNEMMDSLSVKLIKLFDMEKVGVLKNNYFGNRH